MRVNLVCVGRLKEKYFLEAAAEYQKRLSRFCELSVFEVADFDGQKQLALKKEGEAIVRLLKGYVITLEIEGKNLSSEEFSKKIEGAFLLSNEITLVIGGSHGLDDEVRKRSDFALSFGKMTLPHRLMRIVALEQLYRAFSILQGLPYHK